MRKVPLRLVLAALILLLVSCPDPGGKGTTPPNSTPGASGGSLFIVLTQDMKSSNPKDPTIVASYDVLGSGPGRASFQQLGITAASITIDSLEPGDWGITVNGNNSRGMQVGSASIQVTVVEGETTSTDVVVGPSTGDGTLDAYLEWPAENTVSSPSVALTPQGEAPHEIPLPEVVTENGISSLHAAIGFAAGYYTLSVSYKDGDGFTWGGAQAVYITSGKTTKLVFKPFDTTNRMTVDPDISKAIQIVLSDVKSPLGLGQSATVTATLMTTEKHVNYQWYLNGVLQPEITSTFIVVGKTIGKGNYRLDVVVSVNSVLCSNRVLFTIAGG